MNANAPILIAEAMLVYLLVLQTHALRRRFGLAPFYALMGGITAVMSWVTDAGVHVDVGGITFMVGSTVFYTALLLGVFVVYVFDGPAPTRTAIMTVAGVSALVPVIAVVLHAQTALTGQGHLAYVPMPSLRINTASVLTTVADLVFLAALWEFMGRTKPRIGLWLRAFAALLCVMCLDVVLFATGAFFGKPEYLRIMQGTLVSRIVIATFAWPFLYAYLAWQTRREGDAIENRPVLAILREVAQVRSDLGVAREEAERSQRAEREKQALFDNMIDAFAYHRIVTNDDGEPIDYIFLEVNDAFERMTGLRRSDITGKRVTEVLPAIRDDDFDWIGTYGKVATTGIPAEFERYFEPHARCFAVRAYSPAKGFFAVSFQDVTQRMKLEAELKRRERLASIGALASGMAHEINNPVMGIMNYAELILSRGEGDGQTAEFAKEIVREGARIARMTHSLLGLTEEQKERTQASVDLASLVDSVLRPIAEAARTKAIAVHCDIPADLPQMLCDQGKIGRAIAALVENAVEAFDDAASDAARTIVISAVREASSVRLTVKNNGPAISGRTREHLFDPFFTTKDRARHSGLGLWISRANVNDDGGRLDLARDGQGWTCFHVELPVGETSSHRATENGETEAEGQEEQP